ncbi:MAG TPA: hypothetical protein VMZ53_06930 [Kofleriaceae bacterium]|nr:hypothetical protein [Kofleriaceae bacterium]
MRYLALLLLAGGCMVGDETDDVDTDEDFVDTTIGTLAAGGGSPGVNGSHCVASPFNCRFHEGGSRVENAGGGEVWAVTPGASIRDGNGNALTTQTGDRLTFNFGQTRSLAGKAHALALTTTNGSAGWYPFDHIVSEASFRDHVGNVDAKDPGDGRMGCYEIRNSHDASIELKKVVYNSQVGADGHERAGDYLPLVRANGKRSANLIFSVPGFGLGGATSDHFPAGTKFRRVNVPTKTGKPSISIPLWTANGAGNYVVRSGSMRFLYGYIVGGGAKRFGWMAQDALQVSTGCP